MKISSPEKPYGASKDVILYEVTTKYSKGGNPCTMFRFRTDRCLTHSVIHQFWDRPKFKEAAEDNWNVAIKGF